MSKESVMGHTTTISQSIVYISRAETVFSFQFSAWDRRLPNRKLVTES
jgi:hypothetical protein